MQIQCPNSTFRNTTKPPRAPNSPVRTSGPDIGRLNGFPKSRPLDLDHATPAAAARLDEGWILPETGDHPALTEIVEELAAFLCAYGLLADEVGSGRARAAQLPVLMRPSREREGATLWDEPPGPAIATNTALDSGPGQSDGEQLSLVDTDHAPEASGTFEAGNEDGYR